MLIRFETGDGPLTYIAEGDCCSESWFADIYGVMNLLNSVVYDVEQTNGGYDEDWNILPTLDGYNTEDGRCRQESDQVYCYKFTTDRGESQVIFRNSSNGYYGGSIELLGAKPHQYYLELMECLEDIVPDLQDQWHSGPMPQ